MIYVRITQAICILNPVRRETVHHIDSCGGWGGRESTQFTPKTKSQSGAFSKKGRVDMQHRYRHSLCLRAGMEMCQDAMGKYALSVLLTCVHAHRE